MKKILLGLILLAAYFFIASPVIAQTADITKVETFITNLIQVLVTLSGLIAAVFIVWGGIGYITSSGNPEALEKSKKTILYSVIGLTLVLGAYVISNIISQLASGAFGS